MDPNVINAYASVGTFLVAIAATWIGRRQLIEARKSLHEQSASLRAQAIASIYDSYVQLDQFLFQHAEFRPYIYDGKALKDMPANLCPKADAVAELVTDTMYKSFEQWRTLELSVSTPEKEYIQNLYSSSELLRNFLSAARHQKWYSKEFIELALH